MIFGKIRIREVNLYLKPVIKLLLEKHGKVTNPDFENELEEITGIRYRMAKSYTYSPKPWQVVKDNSKIQKFIYECRKKDWRRKAKISLIVFLAVTGIIVSAYAIWSTTIRDNPAIKYHPQNIAMKNKKVLNPISRVPDSLIVLRFQEGKSFLRLGQHKSLDISKMLCTQGPFSGAITIYPEDVKYSKEFSRCTSSQGGMTEDGQFQMFAYHITIESNNIYEYSIEASIPEVVNNLKKQITNQLEKYKFELIKEYKSGDSIVVRRYKLNDEMFWVSENIKELNLDIKHYYLNY